MFQEKIMILTLKTYKVTVIMMGGKVEAVPDVPCGNTVALVGIVSISFETRNYLHR